MSNPILTPIHIDILKSGSRTTTQTGATQAQYNAGVLVIVDITIIGTGSITASIEGYDHTSGKWYTILASAALVGNGTTVLGAYPGAGFTANSRYDIHLPLNWRVTITANNANAVTYSVGAELLP